MLLLSIYCLIFWFSTDLCLSESALFQLISIYYSNIILPPCSESLTAISDSFRGFYVVICIFEFCLFFLAIISCANVVVDLEVALPSRRRKPRIYTILRSYTPLSRSDFRLDSERSIKRGHNVKNALTAVKNFDKRPFRRVLELEK